jgi:hypothetical protein
MFLLGAATVLYHSNALQWFFNDLLPWIPELNIRDKLYSTSAEDADKWEWILEVRCAWVVVGVDALLLLWWLCWLVRVHLLPPIAVLCVGALVVG